MENAPVLTVIGDQISPGTSPELSARFQKWAEESYLPLNVKLTGARGADRYEIVNQSPQYPFWLSTIHHENAKEVEKSFKDPDRIALAKDVQTWIDRRVLQHIWIGYYELAKGFRNEAGQVVTTQETMIEDAPFLHLEGYHLPSEDRISMRNG